MQDLGLQVMAQLLAGLSRAHGEGQLYPGHISSAHLEPCTPRAPHTLTVEEGPIGAAPGLTVLYGFLFLCDSVAHSYRDWSRGARWGQPTEGSDTEQEGSRGARPVAAGQPKGLTSDSCSRRG